MLKKILMALLIVASFSFCNVSEAADSDNENYCCGNYYDNDCCDYYGNENYQRNYRGGRGCCR